MRKNLQTENQGVDSSNLSLGTGNNGGSAVDFASPPSVAVFGGRPMLPQDRVATLVDWVSAPQWLSFAEACFLSGHNPNAMLEIIDADGVDLDNDGQIERESLWQFLEAEALVLHWWDG